MRHAVIIRVPHVTNTTGGVARHTPMVDIAGKIGLFIELAYDFTEFSEEARR
jgi:hypothetical protein